MIKLGEIITKYPECLASKNRFVAIVSDLCNLPEDKVMIKILGDVLDCGIVEEIRNSNDRVDVIILTKYRTLLEGKFGYSPRLCNIAIMHWINAFKEDEADKLSASNDSAQYNSIDSAINNETAQMAPIHEHKYTKIQVPGNCKERGYFLSTCNICGYKYKSDFTSMGNHIWKMQNSLEPSCTEDGYKNYECEVCGNKKTNSIAATGHKFGSATVLFDATCEEPGASVQECEYCGLITETELKALGHHYSNWIEQVKPTCTENGIRIRQCQNCRKMETEEIKAIGHNYSEWERTQDNSQIIVRYCKNCGIQEENLLSLSILLIENGVLKRCDLSYQGTLSIPDSVTIIESFAFGGCNGLTSIDIPDSVTKIGHKAFGGCSNLTNIKIPIRFKNTLSDIFDIDVSNKCIFY